MDDGNIAQAQKVRKRWDVNDIVHRAQLQSLASRTESGWTCIQLDGETCCTVEACAHPATHGWINARGAVRTRCQRHPPRMEMS
jgi:hypothetical protein